MSRNIEVALYRLAHARSGEGDGSTLRSFAMTPRFTRPLPKQATAERGSTISLRDDRATSCATAAEALRFQLCAGRRSQGGVNASLGLDGHGKSLSFFLLTMKIGVRSSSSHAVHNAEFRERLHMTKENSMLRLIATAGWLFARRPRWLKSGACATISGESHQVRCSLRARERHRCAGAHSRRKSSGMRRAGPSLSRYRGRERRCWRLRGRAARWAHRFITSNTTRCQSGLVSAVHPITRDFDRWKLGDNRWRWQCIPGAGQHTRELIAWKANWASSPSAAARACPPRGEIKTLAGFRRCTCL
jgi:hypothetical protein